MRTLAFFGIESTGLTLAIDLIIVCAVVLYLALVYWTYTDARRRVLDPTLVGCATALGLLPFAGPLVYTIIRPPETLEDVRERELELEATKLNLYRLESGLCPRCDYPIEDDYLRCPSCLHRLKERCRSCSRAIDRAWTICPFCEAEVPPARARGGRRASRSTEAAPSRAAAPATAAGGQPRKATRSAAVDEPALAGGPQGAAASRRGGGSVAASGRAVRAVEAAAGEDWSAEPIDDDVQLTDGDRAAGALEPATTDSRAARSSRSRRGGRGGSEARAAGRDGASEG